MVWKNGNLKSDSSDCLNYIVESNIDTYVKLYFNFLKMYHTQFHQCFVFVGIFQSYASIILIHINHYFSLKFTYINMERNGSFKPNIYFFRQFYNNIALKIKNIVFLLEAA